MLKSSNDTFLNAFIETSAPLTNLVANNAALIRSKKSLSVIRPNSFHSLQLEKMKACNNFTSAFAGSDFFDKSFPAYNEIGSNGLDRVTTVLMTKALTGSHPEIELNYSKILVSKGKLQSAKYAAAVPMRGGSIYFSFTDNSGFGSALPTDKVILVAYSKKLQKAAFSLYAGLRKDCEAILDAKHLKGQTVETWIGFLTKDGLNASDSVYTGKLKL